MLAHQINFLEEVLKLNQNFFKKSVVTGKTPFFVIGPHFVPTVLFVLTLTSDIVVLYGNTAFSILVLSTIKRYSIF